MIQSFKNNSFTSFFPILTIITSIFLIVVNKTFSTMFKRSREYEYALFIPDLGKKASVIYH